MEGMGEVLLLIYGSIFFFAIGVILSLISIFAIKLRRIAGKIVFAIGILFCLPFGYLVKEQIHGEIDDWNQLGPLLQAINKNKHDKVSKLIQAGYDVNKEGDSYPSTPLTYAIRNGNFQIIQLLVENGANTNTEPIQGLSPLNEAILRGDVLIVNYLLEHGAEVSPKGNPRNALQPIEYATRLSRCKEIIEALLKYGADVNSAVSGTGTPLYGAIAHKNYEVVRCLLEHGADISLHGGKLESPLELARRYDAKSYDLLMKYSVLD